MKTILKSLPVVSLLFTGIEKACRKYSHWKFNPARNLQKILRSSENIFIVQIGSNDGFTGDPIFSLLKANPSWKALLVEPVPFLFERLKKTYLGNKNVQFENVAIAEKTGKSVFYYVDAAAKQHLPDLPCWFDQLGSFDREHIVRHFGNTVERFVVSTEIDTLPLDVLLDRNKITKVDVLHIDTEGYDWVILRQLDLKKFHPKAILFEYKHLSEDNKRDAIAFLESNYHITDLGGDFLCRRI